MLLAFEVPPLIVGSVLAIVLAVLVATLDRCTPTFRFSIWQLFLALALIAMALAFPQPSIWVMFVGGLLLVLVRPSVGCGFTLGVWLSIIVILLIDYWLDEPWERLPAEAHLVHRNWQRGAAIMLFCSVIGALVSRRAFRGSGG